MRWVGLCIALLLSALFFLHAFCVPLFPPSRSFWSGFGMPFLLKNLSSLPRLHQLSSSFPQELPYLSVLCSSLVSCLVGSFSFFHSAALSSSFLPPRSSLFPVSCHSPWGHTVRSTHLSEGITELFYTNHVCSFCQQLWSHQLNKIFKIHMATHLG